MTTSRLCTFEAFKQTRSNTLGQVETGDADTSACNITDFFSHRAQTVEGIQNDDEYFTFKLQLLEQDGMYVFLTPMFDPPRTVVNQLTGCKYWHYFDYNAPLANLWGESKQWGLYVPFGTVTADPWDAYAVIMDPKFGDPPPNGYTQAFGLTTSLVFTYKRIAGNVVLEVPIANADLTAGDWEDHTTFARYVYSRPAVNTSDFTGATLLPVDPNPPAGWQRYEKPWVPSPDYAALHVGVELQGNSAYSYPTHAGLYEVTFFNQDAGVGARNDCNNILI